MSLDTYCIGEIVGGEAAEFIRAAYSGHRCLGTIHAESAADAIDRILSLARTAAPDESEALLRRMLLRGLDCLVYLQNFKVREIIAISSPETEERSHACVQIWPAADPAADARADCASKPVVPGS